MAMEDSPSSGNPIVILNPAANRGKMEHYRALLRRRLEKEPQAEYVETTRQGEAQERAMYAAKEGRPVIIVGGMALFTRLSMAYSVRADGFRWVSSPLVPGTIMPGIHSNCRRTPPPQLNALLQG